MVSLWVENGNLRDYLKAYPTMTHQRSLAADVGCGLSYLHELSIIHGNLQSMNVFVDASGRACLANFARALVTGVDIVAWESQSRSDPTDMLVDQVSDLFSSKASNTKDGDILRLGCVYFEIFTGEVLSVAHWQITLNTSTLRPSSSSLAWTGRGLTERVWSCMESCWDKNPLRRPTASEVVRLLTEEIMEDGTQMNMEAQETWPAEQSWRRTTEIMDASATNDILDRVCK
ncbi:hypothetical protein C0993_011636, partial [Termitomyces sp. T159_Od127]